MKVAPFSKSKKNKFDISFLRFFGIKVTGILIFLTGLAFSVGILLNVGAKHFNVGAKQAPVRSTGQMMMPEIFPLFIDDTRFTSTLVLVNGSKLSTYADVLVADLNGGEIARQRVDFSSYSQRSIQLREILSAAGSVVTTGRIEIMQSPNLKGMSIAAQLSLTDIESGEPTYIDEEVSMPSSSGSQTLRAVTDPADGAPLVSITSLSNVEQHILIECISGGKRFSKSVTLGAGETLVTEASEERTLHNAPFNIFSGTAFWYGTSQPVGITLISDAAPGSFAAFGLTPHSKKDQQFFSAINFTDPKTLRGTTTVFTGVPVGSSTLLPDGQYVPELALANFSPKDLYVSVKYARSSEEGSSVKEVANVRVRAGSSYALPMAYLKGDRELENSFLVSSNGEPGDLMVKLVSTTENRLQEVDILGKDEMGLPNGGNHPWNLDMSNESTLLLFNPSSKTLPFSVLISGGGVLWRKTYELRSMQTKSINIRDLIRHQVKDDNNNILPSSAVTGQVGWFAHGNPHGRGRILQSNPISAMARNFSCEASYTLCDARYDLAATIFEADESNVYLGEAIPLTCINTDPYSCQNNGDPTEFNFVNAEYYSYSDDENVVQAANDGDEQLGQGNRAIVSRV